MIRRLSRHKWLLIGIAICLLVPLFIYERNLYWSAVAMELSKEETAHFPNLLHATITIGHKEKFLWTDYYHTLQIGVRHSGDDFNRRIAEFRKQSKTVDPEQLALWRRWGLSSGLKRKMDRTLVLKLRVSGSKEFPASHGSCQGVSYNFWEREIIYWTVTWAN